MAPAKVGRVKRPGFDRDRYLEMQSQHIQQRRQQFGGKLYLEFGGKLFDDYHASRVLPGFTPDNKIRMLEQLADEVEIVIVINANDLQSNKMRSDLGIAYEADVLRHIDVFRSYGLYVGSVVISHVTDDNRQARAFKRKLERQGIKVYRHYPIKGYPNDVQLVVSDQGYGRNDYIETTRDLVVVTAPGPGSGKMATCLSQLFHDHRRGISSGYAKYETFPVWNLPLDHPVNVAYEAATADLDDVNMIDPFHLAAYGTSAVNYNRDVEVFPVLSLLFERLLGSSPYQSPTDMGVNMAGYCISDDEICRRASEQEVIRRYYQALVHEKKEEAGARHLQSHRAAHEHARGEVQRPSRRGAGTRDRTTQQGARGGAGAARRPHHHRQDLGPARRLFGDAARLAESTRRHRSRCAAAGPRIHRTHSALEDRASG